MPVGHQKLIEGRHHVPPGSTTIKRPGVATVVEADTRVVLPGDQVVGIGRIYSNHLLSLPAKRTILVYTDVAPAFRTASHILIRTAGGSRGRCIAEWLLT